MCHAHYGVMTITALRARRSSRRGARLTTLSGVAGDSIAIRVNGPKAWSQALTIDWDFTDQSSRHRMTLSNGALIHWANPAPGDTDLTLTLTKAQLLGMLAGHGLEGIQAAGDLSVLRRLLGLLDTPDPGFAIVTP